MSICYYADEHVHAHVAARLGLCLAHSRTCFFEAAVTWATSCRTRLLYLHMSVALKSVNNLAIVNIRFRLIPGRMGLSAKHAKHENEPASGRETYGGDTCMYNCSLLTVICVGSHRGAPLGECRLVRPRSSVQASKRGPHLHRTWNR